MLQTSLLLSLDSQYSSLSSCWVGMLFSDLESVMILQTFVTFIFYQHTKSICLFHFVTFYFALLFRLFLIWLAKHVALWLCSWSWSWLWSWLQVPSYMGNFYYIILYFLFYFLSRGQSGYKLIYQYYFLCINLFLYMIQMDSILTNTKSKWL